MPINKDFHSFEGKIFGTYYKVKIHSTDADKISNEEIKSKLDSVNMQMSVFEKNSEISKINLSPRNEWVNLSPDMSNLLKEASNVFGISNGSFDPTIGTLIDIWGFGVDGPTKFPTAEEVSKALTIASFKNLVFNDDFSAVKKINIQTKINLSAIAKGYGVDKIGELLISKGIENFIVEIGGEVLAYGSRDKPSDGWNIGVAMPDDSYKNAFSLSIKNMAVATSGDYRNFFIKDGQRYSHTISPKTGYPVDGELASVTVLDSTCMRADALATAIMAMGAKDGLIFANDNNISAILFTRTNDGLQVVTSNQIKNNFGK